MLLVLFLFMAGLTYSKDILISFDGSARLDMWQETLDISRDNNAKFTYYISAPYFLTTDDICDHPYWASTKYGEPALKFRQDTAQERGYIARRYAYLNRAVSQGCEIGSHLVGHYNGWNWTEQDWNNEFEFFAWTFEKHGNFDYKNIKGIRAPCLGTSEPYLRVMQNYGLEYDTSTVFKRTHFAKAGGGIVPLWKFRLVKSGKDFVNEFRLPFDYEMGIMKNISHEPKFQEDLFFESLCNEYNLDDGLPLQIMMHFEKFEGDPYWNATKRFIQWVKDKNPHYMTYLEYYESLK